MNILSHPAELLISLIMVLLFIGLITPNKNP